MSTEKPLSILSKRDNSENGPQSEIVCTIVLCNAGEMGGGAGGGRGWGVVNQYSSLFETICEFREWCFFGLPGWNERIANQLF